MDIPNIPMAKHVKERYLLDDQENTIIEEIDDPVGTLPVKDSVIFLGGKRYKIVRLSLHLKAENCLLLYDAMVREIPSVRARQ